MLLVVVETGSSHASFGLYVHNPVVIGKVAGDAVSVVSAIKAVVGTFVAAEGLHVHQVPRLTLAFTGAF